MDWNESLLMFRSIFGYNYRVLRKYLNQNPVICE